MKTYMIYYGKKDWFQTEAESAVDAIIRLWNWLDIKSDFFDEDKLRKLAKEFGISMVIWVWNHHSKETILNPITEVRVVEDVIYKEGKPQEK